MSNWTGGYTHEIPYTHGFYRELTPSLLRFCAVLSGVQPPSGDHFNYCELGFGHGNTACVLAAADPSSQFYGTDFNPDHLLTAQRVTESTRLANAHWFDDSFAEFGRRDLPLFDYVVLHGIYSWVNESTRDELRQFLRQRVRPGGLVYISYNTLPGWSAATGLRQMLFEFATEHMPPSMPVLDRLDGALAYVRKLRAAGSRYFEGSVDAAERLKGLDSLDRPYLVHEFLNQNWTPFYSRTVASELGDAKLNFIGSAMVHDHVDVFCFQGDALKLIQETRDKTLRQTTRDYLLNTPFRRDLFSRGQRPLSAAERTRALLDMRFVLATSPQRVPLTIDAPMGKINLKPEFVAPLAAKLAQGPISLRALTEEPTLKEQGVNGLVQMLCALVGGSSALPCVPESEYDTAPAQRMNAELADQAIAGGDWRVFASPLTGSGLGATRIQQLFTGAYLRGGRTPESWARYAFDVLIPQGQRLTVEGKPLEKPEDNLTELQAQAKIFEQQGLPLLRMHGAL